jgi:hypothetical protein
MTIDRTTPIDDLLSLIGVDRVLVTKEAADRVVLTPATEADGPAADYVDPADYPDTTAYLNAIPGAVEAILASSNAPDSEFEDVPEECF